MSGHCNKCGHDACMCGELTNARLSEDEMKRLIKGIDLDAISRRVAEHMAVTAEKYRQACVVSAIANLNLHICALASCNSVVAGMARLKAEEDRRTLIAELAYKPNTKPPRCEASGDGTC